MKKNNFKKRKNKEEVRWEADFFIRSKIAEQLKEIKKGKICVPKVVSPKIFFESVNKNDDLEKQKNLNKKEC